ncbi:hypothetical protein EDB85DRAFT_1480049 [Lactarius pseudohatsudake]|nr:hypothetical protein EDB85DRAFT_1480049 [Lactarius pseudohatsudake]
MYRGRDPSPSPSLPPTSPAAIVTLSPATAAAMPVAILVSVIPVPAIPAAVLSAAASSSSGRCGRGHRRTAASEVNIAIAIACGYTRGCVVAWGSHWPQGSYPRRIDPSTSTSRRATLRRTCTSPTPSRSGGPAPRRHPLVLAHVRRGARARAMALRCCLFDGGRCVRGQPGCVRALVRGARQGAVTASPLINPDERRQRRWWWQWHGLEPTCGSGVGKRR